MPTYSYPRSAELTSIDPVLLQAEVANDPLLGPGGAFPIETTDTDMLIWEQRDTYLGLMQFRGLNSDPPRVKRVGSNRFRVEPGYYGEFLEVPEDELTRRAAPATWATPIPIDDLVAEGQEQLTVRQTNRMRWILWTLLTTGTYTVLDKDGAIGASDAITLRTFTATVAWATVATATPLADFRTLPISARGTSASFGSAATAYMNQQTWNYLIANTNASDIRGERLNDSRTVQSVGDVNTVFLNNALPKVAIYDGGYLNDSGVYTLFIPDNKVVVVGQRTNGAPLGRFRLTRNVAAPNGRGVSMHVVERGMAPNQAPPPKIEVHRLLNGGPVIWYPNSIFIMNV
jgi:hypothetical protein